MVHGLSETMKIPFRFLHVSGVCLRYANIRRPVRVLNVQSSEIVSPLQNLNIIPKPSITPGRARENKELAIIKKPEENVVPYEKLQKNDARFTKTVGIIKNRKQREKSGKIILEGKRLINDAIKAGMQMKSVYFSRERDLEDINIEHPEKVEVFKVLYQTLKVWSPLNTCPGVMAIFKRPSAEEINVLSQPAIPVTILCDNIREPGNLGSIIRNAAAAGCENILLMKGCVDPWEAKVLRTGCGGHFRIPIVNDIEWSQISNYIPSNSTILVADNLPYIEGINTHSDTIIFDEPQEEEEEENMRYATFNESNQPIDVDESFNSETELEKFEDVQLPCYLYHRMKYPKNNIVLYIGGETHGVDPKIVKLACEYGGQKVKIPMENGMDSINSAFAMTIILYEIKRNFPKVYHAE